VRKKKMKKMKERKEMKERSEGRKKAISLVGVA
jgi:hypothetical protein